jgi:membrane dipeptidase
MREGGLDVEFFAAFVAQRDRTPENYLWAQQAADKYIHLIQKMCSDYSETIALALTPDDAYNNEKNGKLSAYIGMENGFPLAKDIGNVRRYYDMGVRYITLCHTKNNDICDSSTDPNGAEFQGLSEFGRQVVAEMNRLGMIIDISHVSDSSFFDVLRISQAPVIASHSCVRALCDNPRNLNNEMLHALAKNDGVLQVCIFTEYLEPAPPNPDRDAALAALDEKYGIWENITDDNIRKQYRHEYHDIYQQYPRHKTTVSRLVDHIDHIVKLVGIDHVGIGTDFDGGGGIIGCDDVSEMPNITIELVQRGYSEKDISKIWGENFMRVFRKVNQVAAKLQE